MHMNWSLGRDSDGRLLDVGQRVSAVDATHAGGQPAQRAAVAGGPGSAVLRAVGAAGSAGLPVPPKHGVRLGLGGRCRSWTYCRPMCIRFTPEAGEKHTAASCVHDRCLTGCITAGTGATPAGRRAAPAHHCTVHRRCSAEANPSSTLQGPGGVHKYPRGCAVVGGGHGGAAWSRAQPQRHDGRHHLPRRTVSEPSKHLDDTRVSATGSTQPSCEAVRGKARLTRRGARASPCKAAGPALRCALRQKWHDASRALN